jgi:hypothetical protein
MDEDETDVETIKPFVEEEPEQKVVYEQDLRNGSRSNGWAADLLDTQEVASGEGGPPELPDEPHYHRDDKPQKRSPILMYGLAFTYLAFGSLGIYVGVTMLRDLRSGKEPKA